MGTLGVPTWNLLMKSSIPGTQKPSPTPSIMAAKIQTVRYLSRNESFLVTALIETPRSSSSARRRSSRWRLGRRLADGLHALLQAHSVDARNRETQKQLDPGLHCFEGLPKRRQIGRASPSDTNY